VTEFLLLHQEDPMLKWVQNLRTSNSTSIEALCLATSPKHGQENQVAARPPTLVHDKFLNHSAARTRARKFPKQILLCSLQHSNYLISPIDLPFSYMFSCTCLLYINIILIGGRVVWHTT
jgi:hypothetical protein